MSQYCWLEISSSREAAIDYQLRSWTDPVRPEFIPAKPVEEYYGKNCLPLLWLPLFSPDDLVMIEPPLGAKFKRVSKHVPDLAPEPSPALLSTMGAALERFDRQSARLLSLVDRSSPHPDLREFCERWRARLARHAGQWVLFDPGDIFAFVEGEELATLLVDTLKTIAFDVAQATAEAFVREMMGRTFANTYNLTGSELVKYWYYELAGGIEDEMSDWPPAPSPKDLSVVS